MVVCLTVSCHAGLLGAGEGEGSCAAAPFRVPAVKWALGCPEHAPCCSEYGYCRGREEWLEGGFRYTGHTFSHKLDRPTKHSFLLTKSMNYFFFIIEFQFMHKFVL